MRKRPSQISSLLAARPSALRRPPATAGSNSRADTPSASNRPPHLSLVRDDSIASHSAQRPCVRGEDAESPDPTIAIRTAYSAVDGIYALLMELIDRMSTPGRPCRRSPREVAELQARTDGTLRDVDRIVENATVDGTKLLCGNWIVPTAPRGAGMADWKVVQNEIRARPGARRFPIQSMQSSHLGPDAVNCIASLRSGCANSLLLTGVENGLTILRHASIQVAQVRHRLAGLTEAGPVDEREPDRPHEQKKTTLAVARENAASSRSACDDLDFAELTSRLTPGEVLASRHAQTGNPRSRVLRIGPDASADSHE